jgi:hypothetical protein
MDMMIGSPTRRLPLAACFFFVHQIHFLEGVGIKTNGQDHGGWFPAGVEMVSMPFSKSGRHVFSRHRWPSRSCAARDMIAARASRCGDDDEGSGKRNSWRCTLSQHFDEVKQRNFLASSDIRCHCCSHRPLMT